MSNFWIFVFTLVLLILWIVAGVYITRANLILQNYQKVDDNFLNAFNYSYWAAFVTWFLVALFVLLILLSFIGLGVLFSSGVGETGALATEWARYGNDPELVGLLESKISWWAVGSLVVALILVGVTGVLSALAANWLVTSKNFDPNNANQYTAYVDCIIAASICLGAGGLLIIGLIIYLVVGFRNQAKLQELEAKLDAQRKKETEEVDKVKAQLTAKIQANTAEIPIESGEIKVGVGEVAVEKL
jgi:hypothetical protein